jgi:hypothetical protein
MEELFTQELFMAGAFHGIAINGCLLSLFNGIEQPIRTADDQQIGTTRYRFALCELIVKLASNRLAKPP